MANVKDLTGLVFGRLTVVSFAKTDQNGAHWNCECDCGGSITVSRSSLRSGNTASCGCLRIKHGDSFARLYSIWNKVKFRSNIPKDDKNYKHYKHVTMCDEWKDYETFKEWAIGNGYSDELSIDRKDNDNGYHPDNCRWASQNVQIANRKNTRPGKFLGVCTRTGGNTFVSRLRWLGREIYIGSFKTSEIAALARDKYIIENKLPHTMNFTHLTATVESGWIHGGIS